MRLQTIPCPECGLVVPLALELWRNTPGYKGVRYVCPDCFEKLTAKLTSAIDVPELKPTR